MQDFTQVKGKKFVEQIEVTGNRVVDKVKELYAEGGNKVVHVKTPEGKTLLSVPMNVGVAGGALVALGAPLVAAVGALAAFMTKVTLEVERVGGQDDTEVVDPTDAASGTTMEGGLVPNEDPGA